MDPLSITAAVVSLTGVCLVTAKRISDLRTRFNVTSLTLTAILSETTTVSSSLGQIQSALLCFSSTFVSQFERDSTLLQTLDTALIGCSVVILALQEEIGKLEAGLLKARADRSGDQIQSHWLLRMKILWKENIMKELLVQIRGQQASLGFLLQALNMNSMTELHNLMTNNSSLLQQLTENTSTLCKTYPSIRAPLSIFELDRDDGVSFFSHTVSSAGATEFDFDNFLVESKVYRRAFMGGYLRPRQFTDATSDDGGDVQTITDVDNGEEVGETEAITYADREGESDEAESMTSADSGKEFRETLSNTPDTDQWSDSTREKYKILRVKTVDGGLAYMDAELVEELLQQHNELTEKYRKLKEQYEVDQNLKNEQPELQSHISGYSLGENEATPATAKNVLPWKMIDSTLYQPPTLLELIWPNIVSGDVSHFADYEIPAELTAAPEIPVITKLHTESGVKASLSCPFCSHILTGMKQVLGENLRQHIRELHDSQAIPDTKFSLSCSLCSIEFFGKEPFLSSDLDRHIWEMHRSTSDMAQGGYGGLANLAGYDSFAKLISSGSLDVSDDLDVD